VTGKPNRGEARVAVASAACLYVVGATLITTSLLLPHVSSPAGAAAVGVTAIITAAGLFATLARGKGGLTLAYLADLWGIVLIVCLCASTGGAQSPFSMIYFFAVGHAAAFQPRRNFLVASAAGLVAFLAPLAYSHVNTTFGAIALVGVVLALLTTGVVHLALERMREQRRRLELLIAATAMLDTSLDPQQTLERIASTAVGELAQLCVIDLIDEHGAIVTTVAASLDPTVAPRVEQLRAVQHPESIDGHPVSRALSTRSPVVVEDVAATPAIEQAVEQAGGPRPQIYAGGHSATVIPMVARGRLLGVMSFVHSGRPVRGQLAVLEDLTGRAALAFDNASLYAERAHVAHTLRRSLMPAELPEVAGLELESYFRPMGTGNEVGGDFYDVFGDREGCWLLVGDVCGKGAEAAVLTAFLRHTTVAYARGASGPANVLTRVNAAMLEQDFDGRFATAILARLLFGEDSIAVTVASAGHPAGLIVRAGGSAAEMAVRGTLLGVFAEARIEESRTILRAGDMLALYTDGLSEAQAPLHVLDGPQMAAALERSRPRSARETIGALLGLIDLSDGPRDDIAILAARVPNALANDALADRNGGSAVAAAPAARGAA
jgi:stage II sporulation SpoE-like protein/GAF domain-containing protein